MVWEMQELWHWWAGLFDFMPYHEVVAVMALVTGVIVVSCWVMGSRQEGLSRFGGLGGLRHRSIAAKRLALS